VIVTSKASIKVLLGTENSTSPISEGWPSSSGIRGGAVGSPEVEGSGSVLLGSVVVMSPLPVGSTVPVVGCVVGTGPVGSSEGTEVSGETPLEPGVVGVGSGATVVGAVVAFG